MRERERINAFYSGLQAKVVTAEWETPMFPLEIGAYQGDPLSVVIFNTVMNTLVDTLQSRADLGYHLSNASHQANVLQYADDTCLVANSPASCQHLLNLTSRWLQCCNCAVWTALVTVAFAALDRDFLL